MSKLPKILLLLLTIGFSLQAAGFDCRLMNQYGGGVGTASIRITEAGKSSILDEIVTNQWGEFYTIIENVSIENTQLYPAYPNPSKGSSVVPVLLKDESDIQLETYNIRGQKVSSISVSNAPAGLNQIVWQAIDNTGRELPEGVYIIRLITANYSSSIKVALIEQNGVIIEPGDASNIIDTFTGGSTFDFYIRFANGTNYIKEGVSLSESGVNMVYTTEKLSMPFKAEGEYIQVYRDGEWVSLFLKGINLGAAVPGTSPGALAATREEYADWIEELAQGGLNYLRTYTLHFPRFYEELRTYNLAHPNKPLFLIQGVWLDEEYEGNLVSGQTDKFDDDIAEIIDCMHGNKSISHRFGRAHGDFTSDVSPWVLGYIIGREIHPAEVEKIEEAYDDWTSFTGDHFSIQDTCQLDVWMTARLDHMVDYMQSNYDENKPVSVSSWPTLDPIYHPTEDTPNTDEEDETFNMNDIVAVDAPAGFFMSYHAYPYYPDFMSDDPGYQTFSDSVGPNSYVGYLTDLNNHYDNWPLIIAEFGVPSSWGNARFSHSGMYHGGMTEKEQGHSDVRMLHNIYDTGCAGGFVFAWIDEWFKNSWITAPFDSHTERRQFWQNVTNPEQNYGLIGYREISPDFTRWPTVSASSDILSVKADMDNAFFYIKLQTENPLASGDTIWVGIDTYRADLGEAILPNGTIVNNRAEFALAITSSDHSPLFVTQAYNLYGIWHRRNNVDDPEKKYQSIPSYGAPWEPVRWKNSSDDAYQDIGNLITVKNGGIKTSMDGVEIDGNEILVRLPWSLLQVTDPSLRHVMHDDRSNNDGDPTNTSDREEMETDGILLTVVHNSTTLVTGRCLWEGWNFPSNIVQYEKASYPIFFEGAAEISERP